MGRCVRTNNLQTPLPLKPIGVVKTLVDDDKATCPAKGRPEPLAVSAPSGTAGWSALCHPRGRRPALQVVAKHTAMVDSASILRVSSFSSSKSPSQGKLHLRIVLPHSQSLALVRKRVDAGDPAAIWHLGVQYP